MKNRSTLISLLSLTLLASSQLSNAADEVKVVATQVAGQVYMITGKGGNVGLFIGDDGTFVIDDQFAPLSGKSLKQ